LPEPLDQDHRRREENDDEDLYQPKPELEEPKEQEPKEQEPKERKQTLWQCERMTWYWISQLQ
jgi:hypothetical protein